MNQNIISDCEAIADRFKAFIRDPGFPCVGAKAALSRGQLRVIVARDIRSGWDDMSIINALLGLASDYADNPAMFQSLAIIFQENGALDEASFEEHMWARIQSLTDKDEWLGQDADPRVSNDPDDPHFSLSFGGEAFFVVGLHPGASRPARRFEVPVMVFNLHDQFERLRSEGRYEKIRETILDRDRNLAGSVNPMLARHGSISEARQYSGRQVDPGWRCPFSRSGGKESQNA